MQITTEELLQIIGAKEAELFVLRRQIANLQAALSETTESPKD